MDLSKLPGKEPGSEPNPATGTVQPPPPPPVRDTRDTYVDPYRKLPKELEVGGPEVVFHLVAALLLIYLGQGAIYHMDVIDVNGGTISYWQSWFAAAHVPLVFLGLVFIFETIVMAVVRKRWAAWACIVLLAIACVANVGAVVYLMPKVGIQIFNALAAVFAAYGCWSIADKMK